MTRLFEITFVSCNLARNRRGKNSRYLLQDLFELDILNKRSQ